jgi:IS4 transposase
MTEAQKNLRLAIYFEFRADTIAALYKLRWQIELFKQIKQNSQKYFRDK